VEGPVLGPLDHLVDFGQVFFAADGRRAKHAQRGLIDDEVRALGGRSDFEVQSREVVPVNQFLLVLLIFDAAGNENLNVEERVLSRADVLQAVEPSSLAHLEWGV